MGTRAGSLFPFQLSNQEIYVFPLHFLNILFRDMIVCDEGVHHSYRP